MSRTLRRPLLAALLTSLVAAFALVPGVAHADDPAPTTTTLSFTGGNQFGDPTTLTATVTSPAGTPTGTVTFRDNVGRVIAADQPLVDGSATVSFTVLTTFMSSFIADFHGTGGYADSSGSVLHQVRLATVVLVPEPTVARIGPSLKLTLTMAVRATRLDGTPLAGRHIIFTLLGVPTLFDRTHDYIQVCQADTDVSGFATCKGTGVVGAVGSIATGGAWATYLPQDAYYNTAWQKLPVIVTG